ncbi:hypothetical protein M405DRAFT_868122 [Rhizopogon salebrosus TDB-379]|nr:hypothetical protein M405DRAFT_868122 [Rhizopogon salebrosus TDB-379]
MSVLLVISYSSVSMIINYFGTISFCVAGFPLVLLGVALLLQAVIALSGMRTVKILTWSSSAFDLTAALVHHTQLTPVSFQCMQAVSSLDMNRGPVKPSKTQPSAWHAHPGIRKVVILLWALVVACAGWGGTVAYYGPKYDGIFSNNVTLAETPWTFIPEAGIVNSFTYLYPETGSFTVLGWFRFCIILMLVQGPLTLGLHCSELIANVMGDERYWRRATGRKGLKTTRSPLNPFGLVVFLAKAVLRASFASKFLVDSNIIIHDIDWMFGLSFIVTGTAMDLELSDLTVTMLTVQIFNLSIALFIFASFFTIAALHRPRGPQPAAYGHLQTLANLVDEWSPVMWWGHKEDGIPYCHAGTSDHPLPPVKMDCVYAG